METVCWINGDFVTDPLVSIQDRGLLVADGLFETIRVEQGEIADFDAHFSRLASGLEAFKLSINFTEAEIREAALELIKRVPSADELGRLRLTVTRGIPGKGSTVFMSLVPYHRTEAPLELVLTNVIRVAGNPSSRHKTLAYTDNFFAQRQVELIGKNRLALLCNQWGRVACASIGNVFVRSNDTWLTPPISEGALPGITRGKLLTTGIYKGLPVLEQSISVDKFLSGEVLLTNVLRGVEHGTSRKLE